MKNGQAWGKKRHIYPADFSTEVGYAVIPGLDDLSVEDIEHWTLWVRVLTAASVTNITIESNELPDAPAADWWEILGYPQQIQPAGWHRCVQKEGEMHKRIRIRVTAASAGCAATVRAAWLGWGPWVELKE